MKTQKIFALMIGSKVLFGIYKKEVIVTKTKIIFNKEEDDI
jgi:hypothetical protein